MGKKVSNVMSMMDSQHHSVDGGATNEAISPVFAEQLSTNEGMDATHKEVIEGEYEEEFGFEEETVTADITTDLAKENPHSYAGYYWDRKTQFYYLQARYYDPRLGRFLSLDPWRGDMTTPKSLNRYVYSLNNPVNYIDPSGETQFALVQLGWWICKAIDILFR